MALYETLLNTLRPRQNGCHFAEDILNCISWNEYIWISNKVSSKYVLLWLIDNISAMWPTHTGVTQLRWVYVTFMPHSSLHFCDVIRRYRLRLSSQHQDNNFTSVDLSSHVFCGIHPKKNSQGMLIKLCVMCVWGGGGITVVLPKIFVIWTKSDRNHSIIPEIAYSGSIHYLNQI